MKKLFIVCLIAAVFLTAMLPIAFASAENASPYECAQAYAAANPTRNILGGGAKTAANYLSAYLTSLGYAVTMPEQKYNETVAVGTSASVITYEYKHVVGFKDNGKGKTILIGTYYDDYEPAEKDTLGEGADVALSVGALMYIAEKLSVASCEYDVAIAFWGGMDLSNFDVKTCGADVAKVALYINLDSVAAGTNDYLYCDDVPRSQESYFAGIIEGAEANILAAPVYKRAAYLSISDGSYYYAHLGLLGVNIWMMEENIPCVNFVGGAWTSDAGLYRYAGKTDVTGTSQNTFDVINERNGGKSVTENRLNAVSNVVIAGVTDKGLSDALAKAQKDVSGRDLDNSLAYYLIVCIGAVLMIALFILLIVRQGKDRRETVWEETRTVPPSPTDGQSPFSEFDEGKTQPPPADKDDDDVFRF